MSNIFSERSSKISDLKQVRKIKQMITQVSSIMTHFLQNLSYIYESNGINFKVKSYHNLLIRMLCPFELLTACGLANNERLFLKKKETQDEDSWLNNNFYPQSSEKMKPKQTQNSFKLNEQSFQFDQFIKQQQQNKESSFNLNINQQKYPIKEVKKEKSQLQMNPFASRVGREPILGPEVEYKLSEWVREQFSHSKFITGNDIIQHAKKISKSSSFVGSRGWLKRFLNRFPNLKRMLEYGRRAHDYEEVQKLNGKVNLYLLNKNQNDDEDEEDPNSAMEGQGDWYRPYQKKDSFQQLLEKNVKRQNSVDLSNQKQSYIYQGEQVE